MAQLDRGCGGSRKDFKIGSRSTDPSASSAMYHLSAPYYPMNSFPRDFNPGSPAPQLSAPRTLSRASPKFVPSNAFPPPSPAPFHPASSAACNGE